MDARHSVEPPTASKTAEPRLPHAGSRNILITSALPYVNNSPHLGNLIGAVLSADVYARYCRLRGWNAIFMAGTDEYGTATETKAKSMGKTPQQVCDEFYAVHTSVYEWFGISFDYWGRTSTPKQTEITQAIFLDLYKKGFIDEDSLEQLYCETCPMFLADRFVQGTCPFCKYGGAKGDQCDACGKLIDAVTLVNPRCTTCGSTPIKRSSRHLFLNLAKLQDRVNEWKNSRANAWSKNAQAITQTFLDAGLERRCITRDLKWGVPVPLPGWEDKVFYVWFDACIGYISITANYTEHWAQWWQPKPEHDVELVQFMGKDNVPFHTLIFPATLLGSDRDWLTLNRLSTTEYLNYEGGKFSKSRNLGIFGTDAMKEGLAPHVWRYYLLASRPETLDADFTWEDFVSKNNTELVANPGNFVCRVLNLVHQQYHGAIPELSGLDDAAKAFVQEMEEKLAKFLDELDHLQLRSALKMAMNISAAANKFLTKQAPWDLIKTDAKAAASVVFLSVQSTYLLATVLHPFIPTFSDALCAQLQLPLGKLRGASFSFDVPPGHRIADNIVPIVEQIDGDQRILEWWERYGSTQLTSMGIELRVGVVTALALHPAGGDRYVLTVDVGQKDPLSIVAKLQALYAEAELLNSKVVVLCNLKAAKLGGVPSQGMLLGAEDEQGAYGLLRVVDKDDLPCPTGARVVPKGWNCKAAKPMKLEEFLAQGLYVEQRGEGDSNVWWNSVKKRPEVKKQPKHNPKAQGKAKAAAKVEEPDVQPAVVPLQLYAQGVGEENYYAVRVERIHGKGRVK